MNMNDLLEEYAHEAELIIWNGETDDYETEYDAFDLVHEKVTGSIRHTVAELADVVTDKRFGKFLKSVYSAEDDDIRCAAVMCASWLTHEHVYALINARREFVAKWRELGDENVALLEMED